MKTFAIFGDTSQDLTYELGKEYEIEIIPYMLQMGDRHLVDLEDISSKTFYQTMDAYEVLSTGAPSPQRVIEAFDRVKEQGVKEVLCLCSSEKITAMAQVYGAVRSSYEGLDIHIFDTGQIGAGAGNLCLYAAELAKGGKSLEEIVEELERVKDKASIFALFRTLSYLVKGGRFNKYKGLIGNLLSIHPLLTVEDGEITIKDKVRGSKSSLNNLAKTVEDELQGSKSYRLIIFSGANQKEVEELKIKLKKYIDGAELYLETSFTPVLGVHAGPKSIGVATLRLD